MDKFKKIAGTAAIALVVVIIYDLIKHKINAAKTSLPATTTTTTTPATTA